MMWLWAIGPLVIVFAAIWLAGANRRLGEQRLGVPDDLANARARVRKRSSGLREALVRLDPGRSGDADIGREDR